MAKIVHFEIGGTDKAKAAEFYGEIFGWTFPQTGPSMMIEGAGISGHLNALGREPNNYVLIYVGVDDIRETLRLSSRHGGKTLMGPHEIPAGTFAWIQDPTGTTIGLWQAARPAKRRTSTGGEPGERGGDNPFERLRSAFASLDLGDVHVDFNDERADGGDAPAGLPPVQRGLGDDEDL